jgi:hypothetical protein|tara:strand:+ start:486 stop:677 length:192 start_codon:yes stop_codon:yes gene_type:complete
MTTKIKTYNKKMAKEPLTYNKKKAKKRLVATPDTIPKKTRTPRNAYNQQRSASKPLSKRKNKA